MRAGVYAVRRSSRAIGFNAGAVAQPSRSLPALSLSLSRYARGRGKIQAAEAADIATASETASMKASALARAA